jgi:hypothetical protein
MKDGRRFGRPPDPYQPPATPEGRVNVTDPDSRVVKGLRGFLQGSNAQAVTNEHQVVLSAEIETVGADFGHLEPMLDAAQRELAAAGVNDLPEVLLADAGYWHGEQMQRIRRARHRGAHPARHQPPTHHPAQLGGRPLRRDAPNPGHRSRPRALPQTPADDRAGVRANQVQPRPGPLPTTRTRRRPRRMATDLRHPQPPQTAPPRPRGRLTAAPGAARGAPVEISPLPADVGPAALSRQPRGESRSVRRGRAGREEYERGSHGREGSRGVGVDRGASSGGPIRRGGGLLDRVQAPCAHVSLQRLLRRRGTGAELVLREELVTAHPAEEKLVTAHRAGGK